MKNYIFTYCFILFTAFLTAQNITNDTLQTETTVTVVDSTNADTIPVVSIYEVAADQNQPGKPILEVIDVNEIIQIPENDTVVNDEINPPPLHEEDSNYTIKPLEIEITPLQEKNLVTLLDTTESDLNPALNEIYPPLPPSNNTNNNELVEDLYQQQTNDSLKNSDSIQNSPKISKLGEHAPDFDDPNYEKKKEEWLRKYPDEYKAANTQSNNNSQNQLDENELRHLQLEQILKTDSAQYIIEIENLKQFDPDFLNEHLIRINKK